MTKSKIKKSKKINDTYDIEFALKLCMYALLGSMWLKIMNDQSLIPLPIGTIFGLIIASHEHYKNDRKIQYAVLIIASLVGFIAPFGLYISF